MNRRNFLALGGGAIAATIGFAGTGAAQSFPYRLSDAQWRRRLNPRQYAVLRQGETERPGSSPLNREHRRGTFHCAGCGLALFSSATKFETRTGWPSFFRPLPRSVVTRADNSLFMSRTEVLCARCGGHLGHVFNDGPRPTGLRYCMNGVAMTFRPA